MATCLWCRSLAESDAAVTRALQRYCNGELTPKQLQDANDDLIYCPECVEKYHEARESVPALHEHLWKIETTRLLEVFQNVLDTEMEEDDLYLVENGEEQPISGVSPDEFRNRLRYPFMEVLKYPYLLCHRDLCEMVVKVLCKMEEMNSPLQVFDKYQGIYLLMVHPNETVRRWAIATAKSNGCVDRDSFYSLQEAFTCMLLVIELGISLEVMEGTYYSGKLHCLPSHLYDRENEKNYWLGICMLLMQLDSQAMDSLFMGPDKQCNVPLCIMHTMDRRVEGENLASDPFWPALQCFMVILDRLGSKVWCEIEPADAFAMITRAASYVAELEDIRQKTKGTRVKEEPDSDDDDMMSCSQIVYDCYPTERANRSSGCSSNSKEKNINEIFEEMGSLVNDLQSEMGQGIRVYGSTFLWFIPFVRSVMELDEFGNAFVGEVVQYLYNEIDKDVLFGRTYTCDKVTEFFIVILIDIIKLLLSEGCMSTLHYCAPTWVKVIVQCSTLETLINRVPEKRSGSYGVTLASSRFGRGDRMAATGVGALSQACMRLIRSLLKEGERVATVPDLAKFLNRLNRHLRVNPDKVWDLSLLDSENLQNCITTLLKEVVARRAAPAPVLSAPPTPPAEPPENVVDPLQEPQYKDTAAGPSSVVNFIKDEPPWDAGECRDDDGGGGGDFRGKLEDFKAKKEPSSPVRISELPPPPLELNRLRPDLGKIQELKSKLNDSLKIQAFAKSRIKGVEQEQEQEQNQNGRSRLKETVHVSSSSTTDATSRFPISASAQAEEPSNQKWDDDDMPLNVRRKLLKKRLSGESEPDLNGDFKTSALTSSSHAKGKSDFIVISDDEAATADQKWPKDQSEPSSDPDLNESPGRDYDNDLSESQVFEFETQEDMASAWIDCSVVNKKPKTEPTSKVSTSLAPVEPPSGWVNETQAVTDDAIEEACQQAEELSGKPQRLQEAPSSSMPLPPKPESFIQPKSVPLQSPATKPGLAEERGQQGLKNKKKSLLIEPLGQKVRKRRSTLNTSSSESPSVPSVARSLSLEPEGSSGSRPFRSPAVVPPKKIRRPAEPESVAERMGLKKKERKAFDLSQRSLDTLGELRNHGQNVQVESLQKTKKRVRRKSKPQPKLAGKGGKKLLASQDMQYFRQSRGMLQKSTPAAATAATAAAALPKPIRNPVPESLPKPKRTVENMEEEEEEEEDDYQSFLPCSQPDPARAIHQTAKQDRDKVSESSKAKPASLDPKSKESCPSQSKVADGNADCTAEGTEQKWVGYNVDDDYDDEWFHQTQNEPTDMELCSQMEELEANYEDFAHTQRDPVDMDIDPDSQPDTSVGGPDVQQKALFALVPQEAPPATAPPAPSTKNAVDDSRLFLKPGMSPVSQKKAKPSTTKIYAPSSRSDTLVGEMAKSTKAKVARPPPIIAPPPLPPSKTLPQPFQPAKAIPRPSATPKAALGPPPPKAAPQSGFRQPLPFSRPPPVLGLKSAVQNSATSHPPSYKTYSRPEDPVSKADAVIHRPQWYDQSFLIQAVLKWEYRMFKNYKDNGLPDDLCPWPLREVPTVFSSHEEYFGVMYPLLLANVFEEMVSEWHRSGRIELHLKVQGLEYTNRTANASFTASLTPEQEIRQSYPKEDDLVLLWLPKNTSAYVGGDPDSNERHASFGYVSRSNVISNGAGQPSTLNLTIQTRGNVSSVDAQHVRCEVISSLISTLREFRALCQLKNGIMARPYILLKPHVAVYAPCEEGLPDLDMPEYNMDQAKAIGCGVAMVRRRQYSSPKILLIHGPPGTGKSKTIVGLLQRLFSEHNESASANRHNKAHRMRVLLCAPSNAAIDNLMKKVIVAFKEKCRDILCPQGNCGDINLVRLGSEKTISKGVIAFSLDSQTTKKTQINSDSDVQRVKQKLDQEIECFSRLCARTQKQSPEFKQLMAKKQQCLSEREKLSRKLREFRSKRQEVQAVVLRDAHVICCTLSTSGSSVLESAFRRLGREPFSCVIVDEAGQAKETESLIPLLHRCPALILVGDPEQLTPTVVSQRAKELGYDQSLMARLWKSLQPSNPTVFLSIQYRMHPNICEFPSKYIYSKRLKNDCETAQKRCSFSWPFEPYRVFDVTDGRENKENDSFSNHKEVKLVLMLLKLIGEKQAVRVGVITPYNAQKQQILRAVALEARGNKPLQVEVDTVDGFQGREMDCIIVSCVRASSEMGSIGFVGNRQRMNVTITRARFSLFILGHLRTLKEHSDWGALIKDARNRGTIIKTQERDFREATTKVLKPACSHPHAVLSRRHSNATSPPQPTHIPIEKTTAPPVPIPLAYSDPNGGHSPPVSSTTCGPSERARDPRLSARPSEPSLLEPVRERRQDRDRRAPADLRQHPHALPSRCHGNAASPPQPTHIPIEKTNAPPVLIPLAYSDPNGSHSPTVSSSTSGPSDRARDPRLSARPSDPRLSEPIREHRQDRDRRASAAPRQHPLALRAQRDSYQRSSIPPVHSRSPRRRSQDRPPSSPRRHRR
ncbi:probable helicase senataxin isoform X2 [Salminus brasiliensis]|uniref:probable helicase senataxin isoform X2 n=1 Tax=Salminus brasiliensis TaxID=930266 RepID=UPI003B82DFA7